MKRSLSKRLVIALGSDHAGFPVKSILIRDLKKAGYKVVDMGTNSEEPADYPDYAWRVAQFVKNHRAEKGILACGTGLGMCIAANKVRGIRAVTPWSVEVAKLSAEHNQANILCVPSRFLPIAQIKKIVQAWLVTSADLSERHQRRLKKIRKIEAKL